MNYNTVLKVESIFRRVVDPKAIAEFANTFQELIDISTDFMSRERQQMTDNELLGIIIASNAVSDTEWGNLSDRWEALLNTLETKIQKEGIELAVEVPRKEFSILS